MLTKAWGKVQFHAILFQFLMNLERKKRGSADKCLAMVKQASSHIRSRALSLKLNKIDNRLIPD